jgi:hypothetical protein
MSGWKYGFRGGRFFWRTEKMPIGKARSEIRRLAGHGETTYSLNRIIDRAEDRGVDLRGLLAALKFSEKELALLGGASHSGSGFLAEQIAKGQETTKALDELQQAMTHVVVLVPSLREQGEALVETVRSHPEVRSTLALARKLPSLRRRGQTSGRTSWRRHPEAALRAVGVSQRDSKSLLSMIARRAQ